MRKRNLSLIKIGQNDRTADGNLLPEIRERLMNSIKNYLRRSGYLNVSEIAMATGLSRQTISKLVDGIVREWQADAEEQIVVQEKWHESVLKDIDQNPETFTKEKIVIIKLKSAFLTKINSLHKLSQRNISKGLVGIYMLGAKAPEKIISDSSPGRGDNN